MKRNLYLNVYEYERMKIKIGEMENGRRDFDASEGK